MCNSLIKCKTRRQFCLLPNACLGGSWGQPCLSCFSSNENYVGPVLMHPNSSSLWGDAAMSPLPGASAALAFGYFSGKAIGIFGELTWGLCWWILWINARSPSLAKLPLYTECCLSITVMEAVEVLNFVKAMRSSQNRHWRLRWHRCASWLSQLPLFFTRPCCYWHLSHAVFPCRMSTGHSWCFAPLCCCRL